MVLHCCFSSCYSIPEHNSFIFILVVIHNTVKEIFFFPFFKALFYGSLRCLVILSKTVSPLYFSKPNHPLFHNAFWVSNQM